MTTKLTELEQQIIKGKSDAEIRQGGFYLGRRLVTQDELTTEAIRRLSARSYSAQLVRDGVEATGYNIPK
jgi:hypothetical protein